MEPRRHRLRIGDVTLSVLEAGEDQAPPLVMLHGMRDTAWSLLDVAAPLSGSYRVVLPELRGHGASDWPGAYSIDHFLFDLYHVTERLSLPPAVVFGHSLGGQIAARYAALFPDRVRALVVVEGLGPPARPGEDDPAFMVRHHATRLLETLGVPIRQRPLPDLGFAAERLLANNPRLASERARRLAGQMTRHDADGKLVWAFDARVASVFLGVRREDSERYWRQVRCPTLVVSGDLAGEYWRGQMPGEWRGEFAPGELEARIGCFADAEHVAFADAGHMVHYDIGERLTHTAAEFLERRL